jgi:hypothetical protein
MRSSPASPGFVTELLIRDTVVDGATGATVNALFDVSPDGQRFVMVAPRASVPDVLLTVTVNWTASLK